MFIFDSYATRIGKGTHAAINRFQRFAKVNRYALKCDIKKYFLNGLDHFVKEVIWCRYYLRYMDDFLLLHADKDFLWKAKARVLVGNEQDRRA